MSSTDVKIKKLSLEGMDLKWQVSMSNCFPKDVITEMFSASTQSILYVVCSASNLISQYDSADGSLIRQVPTNKGNVVAIKCSSQFLFILHNDGTVFQYTLDLNYVNIYPMDNYKTPKYNSLKVDDKYIFYVICSNDDQKVYIVQWEISSISPTPTIAYEVGNSTLLSENEMGNETIVLPPKLLMSEKLEKELVMQNAYFNPMAYVDENNDWHLIYYSGDGNLKKGSCGDIFVHDLIITELTDDAIKSNADKLIQVYQLSGRPNIPISRYASGIIKNNGTYLYLIHGGISCDYQTSYSELFCIDVSSRQYLTIFQNNTIP